MWNMMATSVVDKQKTDNYQGWAYYETAYDRESIEGDIGTAICFMRIVRQKDKQTINIFIS